MVDSSDSGSAMPPTGRGQSGGALGRSVTADERAKGQASARTSASGKAQQKPQRTGTRAWRARPGRAQAGAPEPGHRHATRERPGLQELRSTPYSSQQPEGSLKAKFPLPVLRPQTLLPSHHHRFRRPPPGNLEVSLQLCSLVRPPESGLRSVFTSLFKREMGREDQMEPSRNQFLKRPQKHRGE